MSHLRSPRAMIWPTLRAIEISSLAHKRRTLLAHSRDRKAGIYQFIGRKDDCWAVSRDFARASMGPEFCDVVGEERGLVAGAGDGNVAEAGVEQVRVDPSVSVNENAVGGEPLRAVTGDGIAVVEMTMLDGVEFDLPVVVEADGQAVIGVDYLDYSHVAICNAE